MSQASKTVQLAFRVPAQEKRAIKRAARGVGETPSEFIRRAVRRLVEETLSRETRAA